MDASAANANREKWFAVTFSRTAGANPDLIRLDYAAGVANNLHLDLYDAAGQLLTSGSATAQGETIRQGGLSGLYYIRVRGASTTVTNPGFALEFSTSAVQTALRISDVTLTEGNAGTKAATFTVSLSAAAARRRDGQLRHGQRHGHRRQRLHGHQRHPDLRRRRRPARRSRVTVNGDTAVEPDETFFVNLSSPDQRHHRRRPGPRHDPQRRHRALRDQRRDRDRGERGRPRPPPSR